MNTSKCNSIKEFIQDQNAYSRDNRKNAFKNLFSFTKLFVIYGIDVKYSKNNETKGTAASFMKYLMLFAWLLAFFSVISDIYIKIKHYDNTKKSFVALILCLLTYLMWNHIIKQNATKLIEILRKLKKIEKMFGIPHHKNINQICCLIFTSISFLVICLYARDYSNETTKEVIRIFSIGMINVKSVHWSISAIFCIVSFFYVHYVIFFAHYFAFFYIIVCYRMAIILYRNVKLNKNIIEKCLITTLHFDDCFRRYNSILILFDKINSVLSFPIFLNCSVFAIAMFYMTITIISESKENEKIDLSVVCILITNFILFTAIVFTASTVYEADKEVKKSNIKILRSLSQEDRKEVKESIEVLSHIFYSPPFALTGWDIFEFTKTFYFTAAGCYLTYSLLLINL